MGQTTSRMLPQVRESLNERCIKLLVAYRRHCALSSRPNDVSLNPHCSGIITFNLISLVEKSKIVLPESFRMLPLYILALQKTKALKGKPLFHKPVTPPTLRLISLARSQEESSWPTSGWRT